MSPAAVTTGGGGATLRVDRRRGTADRHPALETVEPGEEPVGRVVGAGKQDPRAHQLEEQPRRGGAAHLGQARWPPGRRRG